MWRTGWGQVSGEWDEQQKISWEKDVEDWVGASVWKVGRTAEDRETNRRTIKAVASRNEDVELKKTKVEHTWYGS